MMFLSSFLQRDDFGMSTATFVLSPKQVVFTPSNQLISKSHIHSDSEIRYSELMLTVILDQSRKITLPIWSNIHNHGLKKSANQ